MLKLFMWVHDTLELWACYYKYCVVSNSTSTPQYRDTYRKSIVSKLNVYLAYRDIGTSVQCTLPFYPSPYRDTLHICQAVRSFVVIISTESAPLSHFFQFLFDT